MAEYPYFPMFVDLSRRRVLVVGGGRIAARRVKTLIQFCPSVTVVAPELHPDIAAMAEAGRIDARRRTYLDSDLDGVGLALACTDDRVLNAAVAAACRTRGIPANNASDKRDCDFLFPGVARRDALVVGVTAGGEDHRLARQATEALRHWLEHDYTPHSGEGH